MNWYLQNGKESDVVISSRIRLARNLKDSPISEYNPKWTKNIIEKAPKKEIEKKESKKKEKISWNTF